MTDAATEYLVIGAGVVGLAITRALAMAGRDVILIDKNKNFGMETSSRNSEVIHGGMYYPEGSLKARLCAQGARMMYDYCADHGVTTHNYGKLIVATDASQRPQLDAIKARGVANNTPGLEIIEGAQLAEIEPHLKAVAALYSPLSGVVDSGGYMLALAGDALNHGAIISCRSQFFRAEKTPSGYCVQIGSQDADMKGEEMALNCTAIINAAGHGAHHVSGNIEGINPMSIPPHYMAKGQYFTTTKKPPFKHLIYPIQDASKGGGLGIHLTLDAGGGARFGPDIQWVDEENYDVNPDDRIKFHDVISSYWPTLKPEDLTPAWAGLRPKIYPDASVFQDFTIHGKGEHGGDAVTALYGIDSPGLTSSLALAEYVLSLDGVLA